MAEGTYEFECMRAELLGIDKPDQEEFEKALAERQKVEQEEIEAQEASVLDKDEESLENTGGKLDELNSILTATQSKINRLKQSARGSITTMFRGQSVDETASSSSSSRRGTTGDVSIGGDINDALDNLEEMQKPPSRMAMMRNASLDIQGKMTSHLDKLDMLIHKADKAEQSMAEQTKQMRKIAK